MSRFGLVANERLNSRLSSAGIQLVEMLLRLIRRHRPASSISAIIKAE
jgi:hypothetical protein